jgi:hypothetical protein
VRFSRRFAPRQQLSTGVILDFNRESSEQIETPSSLFVGEVAKFYYQPAPKISKRKFHLVLPESIVWQVLRRGVDFDQ